MVVRAVQEAVVLPSVVPVVALLEAPSQAEARLLLAAVVLQVPSLARVADLPLDPWASDPAELLEDPAVA